MASIHNPEGPGDFLSVPQPVTTHDTELFDLESAEEMTAILQSADICERGSG